MRRRGIGIILLVVVLALLFGIARRARINRIQEIRETPVEVQVTR